VTAEADNEQGARPRLRRQLDALADWLAKSHWTVPEAAALLVGFLPPYADGSDSLGAWLPGREPWPHREPWEFTMRREIEDMQQRLATIPNLGLKPPKKIMTIVVGAGIVPPWLHALSDKEQTKLLPAKLRAKVRATIGAAMAEPEENGQAKGSYAARYKERPDWDEEIRDIERLFKEGKTNSQIASALAKLGYKARTQNSLDRLIREFREEKITAEEKTVGFRRYKERLGRT
jgi:ribosomal protein L19E